MSNVATRVRVHRPGPGQVELREGGGWVSVLGIPCLAVGVFAALGTAGLLRVHTSDGAGWMLPLFAAAFSAVGLWLVLGRGWTAVDAPRRTVTRRFGLLAPIPALTRVHRLDEFSAVRIAFTPGDSDSSASFRVELLRRPPGKALRACSSTRYASARAAAEALAETAELPLEDASTAHATVTAPGDLRRGLAAAPDDGVVPPAPASLRTEVRPTATGGVRLRLPWRASLVPVAAPLVLIAALLSFLGRSPGSLRVQGPLLLSIVVLAAVAFGLVGLPLLRGLGRVEVVADPTGLEVRERGRTARIAAGDVLDVDCSAGEERFTIPTVRGTRAPARGRLRGWLAPLLSQGIQVKHRGGILTFGEGLPADELAWLRATIRRALRAAR